MPIINVQYLDGKSAEPRNTEIKITSRRNNYDAVCAR
jgi:hypothetical protein